MKKTYAILLCGVLFFVISLIMKENLLFCFLMGVTAAIISFALNKVIMQKKAKQINQSYEMDLPDLMVHIAMFAEAGMGIQDAIEKAVHSGEKRKKLYADLFMVFENIRKGYTKDLITGLEELANSRKSPALSNFCITIVQNMRKGSGELSDYFLAQAQLQRNERRRLAGKLADEAATLLIIPSTLVLIALIVLLLAPAVLEMFKGMK